jgi:hypothetical protein
MPCTTERCICNLAARDGHAEQDVIAPVRQAMNEWRIDQGMPRDFAGDWMYAAAKALWMMPAENWIVPVRQAHREGYWRAEIAAELEAFFPEVA